MTTTNEDYIKRIYVESQNSEDGVVTFKRLSELSGVTPGTITTMMKSLADNGHVEYFYRKGVRLTARGDEIAVNVLRRHRLIELFLVKTLNFDWTDVHDEAEILEHAVSEKVLNKIDEHLGFPSEDPHGDPIPSANGSIDAVETIPLSKVEKKGNYTITRITRDDRSFLTFLRQKGLVPGAAINVGMRDDLAETIEAKVDADLVTLSLSAARFVLLRK